MQDLVKFIEEAMQSDAVGAEQLKGAVAAYQRVLAKIVELANGQATGAAESPQGVAQPSGQEAGS